MKRLGKILFYSAAVFAALILLASAAGLLVVRSEWFHRKVRERLIREIETATGGRVELGAFRFDWRALRARVQDLVIHGTEPPEQAPLFRAASIQLELKIISVPGRAVDLRSLKLERPQIHLLVYPDGRTNLPAPKVPRPRRKGVVEQILDLAVDRFDLDDGRLLLGDRRIPLSVEGEKLRTRWLFDFDGPRYRGSLSFARLKTEMGRLRPLALDASAELALERERLEILHARVAYRDCWAEVRGKLEDWKAPRLELLYRAQLRLSQLTPALGLGEAPRRGVVDVEGRGDWRRGDFRAEGRLQARELAIERDRVRVERIRLGTNYLLAPQRAEFSGLHVAALGGRFAGQVRISGWRDLTVDGEVQGLPLQELARWQGRAESGFDGQISGPIHMSARLDGSGLRDLQAGARLAIIPTPEGNPLSGAIQLGYAQAGGTLRFGPSSLLTPHTRLEFAGVAGERLEVAFETRELEDVERARALVEGTRAPFPLRLHNGALAFRGAVLGPLERPRLEGALRLKSFELEGRRFDSLEARIQASPAGVRAESFELRAGGMRVNGSGRLALENWKPADSSPLEAALNIQVAELSSALEWLGRKLPVRGEATAAVKVAGRWAEPQARARVVLRNSVLYDQPVEHLEAEVQGREGRIEVASAQVRLGGSPARFSGVYTYPSGLAEKGHLKFRVTTADLPASAIRAIAQAIPGLDARLRAELAGEVDFGAGAPRLRHLDGRAVVERASLDGKPLGGLTLKAATQGNELAVTVRGKLAGATMEGESHWRLEAEYPGSGALSFTRMQLSTLLARLGAPAGTAERRLPFEALMEGKLRFEGEALDPASWKAVLEVPEFELLPVASSAPRNKEVVSLRNQEPWLIELNRKEARIRQVRLAGNGAELTVSGTFLFGSRYPFNLRLQGGVSLTILEAFEPNLRAAGRLVVDAALRGALARPDLYGRAEIRDAALNYGDLPNGLDKLNGVLFLYRDRATIERLTGESGGGKVSLDGFATFGEPPSYRFQLRATGVRVRYPEGASSTADVTLAFAGTGDRSVLSGDVMVTRAAFHPRTDLGSMLARSARPTQPPANAFLEGMRLDVHIRTAPQIRLETSLTRSIQAEADLRLRGTALRPALLGRVLVSQGEVLFFGNRYTIDSGEVLFVNPSRIEPVVNLNLQTRARGVEVTLNINGPLNKTTVTYRSDPPLPFSDIVALLATGRAPSTSPGLAGARSEFAQSWEQAGASALVSQAIASPLAGRLQRFLGVSRLKIDPTVRGIENTPEAHLTLEQQITPDVTLVYITNLARAQQQTIRLEWDFTRNWSALAVREANGLFGVDFLYKKRFK